MRVKIRERELLIAIILTHRCRYCRLWKLQPPSIIVTISISKMKGKERETYIGKTMRDEYVETEGLFIFGVRRVYEIE
ncbi:hypothetical protein CsSME_00015141 [Camellia sinensis var. sinensis]